MLAPRERYLVTDKFDVCLTGYNGCKEGLDTWSWPMSGVHAVFQGPCSLAGIRPAVGRLDEISSDLSRNQSRPHRSEGDGYMCGTSGRWHGVVIASDQIRLVGSVGDMLCVRYNRTSDVKD